MNAIAVHIKWHTKESFIAVEGRTGRGRRAIEVKIYIYEKEKKSYEKINGGDGNIKVHKRSGSVRQIVDEYFIKLDYN